MVFGKNLKKIRKVHSLSQQDFADLFDLKRATLGAYEENRSNPKIDTAIKIANHFSIGLEDLLTKELTINDLLHFNENITTATSMPATPVFEAVACITPEVEQSFLNEFCTSTTVGSIYLPYIHLPNITNASEKLAYVVHDLSMSGGADKLLPKDIVIGEQVPLLERLSLNGNLVLVATKNAMHIRNIEVHSDKSLLKSNHPGVEPIEIAHKNLLGLWKVVHIFRYSLPQASNELEERLSLLENTIAALHKKD